MKKYPLVISWKTLSNPKPNTTNNPSCAKAPNRSPRARPLEGVVRAIPSQPDGGAVRSIRVQMAQIPTLHSTQQTPMKKTHIKSFIMAALIGVVFTTELPAQVPGIISYQGRVQVGGANFTGTGQFKFALPNPLRVSSVSPFRGGESPPGTGVLATRLCYPFSDLLYGLNQP
jgi:hypothetical protein